MKFENGKLYKWLAKDRKYEDGTDKYYYHFTIGKYYSELLTGQACELLKSLSLEL